MSKNKDMNDVRKIFKDYNHKDFNDLLVAIIDWKNKNVIDRKGQDLKEHECFIIRIEDKDGDHYCEAKDYDNVHRVYELLPVKNTHVFAIEDVTVLLK